MHRSFCVLLSVFLLAACQHDGLVEPTTGVRNTDAAIRELGFKTVALPSTGYGPGLLVTSVTGFGLTEPLHLAYICDPEYTKVPRPVIDDAQSSNASRMLGGKFDVSIGALGLGAAAQNVESVTLKLSNLRIEQMPKNQMRSIQRNLGPECSDLLNEFKAKGIARQTQQALRADVVYTATLKRGASAEVKNLVIQKLQGAFGGSVSADSDISLTGSGLYYGLVLDEI